MCSQNETKSPTPQIVPVAVSAVTHHLFLIDFLFEVLWFLFLPIFCYFSGVPITSLSMAF